MTSEPEPGVVHRRIPTLFRMLMIALMYHDIVPQMGFDLSGFQGPGANIYKLDPRQFRNHLRAIAATARPNPSITFDDGGVGAMAAAEILEEFGFKGWFFVTTGRIGTTGFLNEDQIRELRTRGHVVGSHSHSHPPRMSRCTAAQLDLEWRESVHALERILREPVNTASVPGGYYSSKIAAAAARAGIRTLFTSEPTVSVHKVGTCTVLGRFAVRADSSERWLVSLAAGYLRPRFREYVLWNGKKLLKTLGGEVWLKARAQILASREARQEAAGRKAAGAG